MIKFFNDRLNLFLITILPALVMVMCYLVASTNTDTCVATKTVVHIGGCDAFGKCGVLFEDYTFGKVDYPVEGIKACSSEPFKDTKDFPKLVE